MELRITPLRVATAALFVLAGVGLASLLSPLVGTALATVGTVANISDHSFSAFFAKVDSAGKLAVTPLQWKPPANTKACLFGYASTVSVTTMNAVGFYGG